MGKNCIKDCCLSKNVHNFLKNCPQALLACLRLFPCLPFTACNVAEAKLDLPNKKYGKSLSRICIEYGHFDYFLFNNYLIRAAVLWESLTIKKCRKAEHVQRRVCFVNVQSSLHENVVFSVFARMDNAAYIIFVMWNSVSSSEAWYHFQFNISCGVAVTVRSHQ